MASTLSTKEAEPPTGGVLGAFAHPDDETITAGGLLASAARVGLPTTVVVGTRGERGQVIPLDLVHLDGDPAGLAHQRARELARACSALGVRSHYFLDEVPGLAARRPARFTDSGMVWVRPGVAGPVPEAGPDALSAVPVEVPARLLAARLRVERPQVVITEDPRGGYGHPDHVHMHQIAMRAVELANEAGEVDDADDPLAGLEPWRVPVVVWVVAREDRYRESLRWLADKLTHAPQFGTRGDVLATLPPTTELPTFVFPPEKVDVVVDFAAVLPAVVSALRAHRSQLQDVQHEEVARRDQPARGWFAVANGLLLPLLGSTGLYLVPGFDRVGDLYVAPVHHSVTEKIPVLERYSLAGTFGLARLDVRDRLGDTRGTDRLAAFLGVKIVP
ncbi:PIG-L family deacetylase [Georgenia ruanii]|uniref:PIG-L family deacetylase n=1 Tax=Georgenia ruanii TaxID=348442 RepID=UPI001265444D|nr:PIG-L family deacetylase [Georgenia ruanii]